jgi:glycosyltransferase involved in cell wall biosynthesis
LAQAGYRVTLIAPADFERDERDGITVLGVSRAASRFQRPWVWWRLYRLACRLRPDVIHFHDPELLFLAPLFRITWGRWVRIVYDVHEYFVDSLANKFWIPRWLRPITRFTARWVEKILVRGVHGIICAVDGQKPLYVDSGVLVAVVRNLPVADLFEDAEPHPALDSGGFKLIYVGLILPERGIDVLLEAMHVLHQRDVRDIYLYLIGPDTSPAYTKRIQSFVQTHQLTDHVRWLGYVPHGQIKHYLANAHVGMIPGLRTRQFRNPGLSTKLFEYMLCGLPIISVDHSHHRIYVEECNGGLMVSPKDASAYAEAIVWLRDHPSEARAMGQRGRTMVLNHYTWEQEQSRLLAFYQELLLADQGELSNEGS